MAFGRAVLMECDLEARDAGCAADFARERFRWMNVLAAVRTEERETAAVLSIFIGEYCRRQESASQSGIS